MPLAWDLYENIKKAAKYGYAGLEVHGRETVEYNYDEIEKISKDCGAGIATIVTGRLYTEGKKGLLDEDPAEALAGVKKYIDIARCFKAELIVGWVKGVIPPGGDRQKYLEKLGPQLRLVNDYAADRGIKISVEVINRYETNIFNTAQETLDFINTWSLDNTYVHLDTFHMNIEESDPFKAIRLCGKKLGYFHVSDNTRRYPGSGQLDFKRILSTLKEVDYSGYVSLECLPLPDRDTAAAKAMEHLKKCES